MDITDEAQVRHAYEQVLDEKGRIDWLINNAGLSQRALIADTSMQTERAIMEIDYFSQVFLTKLVLPTFLAQKSGRIAYISSVAGLLGTQYRASYSAAKAAIHMWANSLRAEVAQKTVSALLKGQEYIVVGGRKEKLGVLVSRLSPSTLYKMIRKMKVK